MKIRKRVQTSIFTKKPKNFLVKKEDRLIPIILIILLAVTFLISFTLGRFAVSFNQLIEVFYDKLAGIQYTGPNQGIAETVIFQVRLPRILAAILVGGALSMSGASYQGLFKNPMVSGDILGASSGAGFGAVLAMLFSFSTFGIQVSAFIFGLGAVALTYTISSKIGRGNSPVLVLVLTGMIVTALFTSGISLIKYVADPDNKLPAITFWLMGGLSSITTKDLFIVIFPMLIGAIPLLLLRWKLNILSFGEEEAQALGIDTTKIRTIIIICSTILTASTVSICGIVGWVGLVIPHFSRMIVGPNYKVLLPVSLIIGSIYLMAVDDIARCLFSAEIPLGILTSMIGAPFFIYLLLHGKRGWV